jgi:hypothetical protein
MQKTIGAVPGTVAIRLRQSSNTDHNTANTGRSSKRPKSFHFGGRPGSSPSLPATDGKSAGVNHRLLELESTSEFIQNTIPIQRRNLVTVFRLSGFPRCSETGQTKRRLIQTYPVTHSMAVSKTALHCSSVSFRSGF